MLHPWGIITFYTLFKTLFTTGMSQPCIHRGKHPSLPAPTHKHLHTAHSPALLCWMHNTCNEIMFPVGMAVAGGWRCALNINVTTPRLAGSIGVMVGGKWVREALSLCPKLKWEVHTERGWSLLWLSQSLWTWDSYVLAGGLHGVGLVSWSKRKLPAPEYPLPTNSTKTNTQA